jgi:hypothetical protein
VCGSDSGPTLPRPSSSLPLASPAAVAAQRGGGEREMCPTSRRGHRRPAQFGWLCVSRESHAHRSGSSCLGTPPLSDECIGWGILKFWGTAAVPHRVCRGPAAPLSLCLCAEPVSRRECRSQSESLRVGEAESLSLAHSASLRRPSATRSTHPNSMFGSSSYPNCIRFVSEQSVSDTVRVRTVCI